MSSRPRPFPHTVLSPMTVPVVAAPFFQSIMWIAVVPTAWPWCSTTQTTSSGFLAILSSHSFSISMEGGLRSMRNRVTSMSSNKRIIAPPSSGFGGRSRTSLPSMIGPYMARKIKGAHGFRVATMGDRLRPLWDFDDLDASEQRFRAQLNREVSDEGRAEVLTQLARVYGLREQIAEGDRLIDQATALASSSAIVSIRIQLERGRLLRSGGDDAGALRLFKSAFEAARQAGKQFLAADAAHMAALAAPDRQAMLAWTDKGTRIAESSSDPEVYYWLGPLLNNLGGAYMDSGEYAEALDSFQRALEVRKRYPEMPVALQHAKEAVVEALTALGREEEVSRV